MEIKRLLLTFLLITGANGIGSDPMQAAGPDGIQKLGRGANKVEEQRPDFTATIKSGLTGALYGLRTLAGMPGSTTLHFSTDTGKTWQDSNWNRMTRDSSGQQPAGFIVSHSISSTGRPYLLVIPAVSLYYKDTSSGAGFLKDPGKLEVEVEVSAGLFRPITNFVGISADENERRFKEVVK